jgi:hypothetical protein
MGSPAGAADAAEGAEEGLAAASRVLAVPHQPVLPMVLVWVLAGAFDPPSPVPAHITSIVYLESVLIRAWTIDVWKGGALEARAFAVGDSAPGLLTVRFPPCVRFVAVATEAAAVRADRVAVDAS